jgi:hypothetical protein
MTTGRQLSLTCPQWPLRLQSQASPRRSSLGSWARARHIAELLAVGVAASSRQAVVLTSSLDRRLGYTRLTWEVGLLPRQVNQVASYGWWGKAQVMIEAWHREGTETHSTL